MDEWNNEKRIWGQKTGKLNEGGRWGERFESGGETADGSELLYHQGSRVRSPPDLDPKSVNNSSPSLALDSGHFLRFGPDNKDLLAP